MKYIMFAGLLLLQACTSGFSVQQCYLGVKAAYPDSDVALLPKNDYRFLVRKPNGDVIIAETMECDNSVTREILVFKGK